MKKIVVTELVSALLATDVDRYNSNMLDRCPSFDPTIEKCQACKFYLVHPTCPIWESSFGVELQQQLIRYSMDQVRIDLPLLDRWASRKIPAAGPKQEFLTVQGDSSSSTVPVIRLDK